MNLDDTTSLRLLYLTCTELIANYGVFDTQVKSLLQVLAQKSDDSVKVHLFSLVSVLRLLKWRIEIVFIVYREAFDQLQQELQTSGIRTTVKPLLTAYPFDIWRPVEMILALPLAVLLLATYVRRHQINLLHCRSYHAGLLGLIIKKMMGVPYIFDPRSPWVEEQCLMGKLSKDSLAYRLWKQLEVTITRHAHACIVVSEPMKMMFAPISRRVEVIYTTASESYFCRPEQARLLSFHEKSDLERLKQAHQLFVFNVNNFNQWNSLDHLLTRYKELSRIAPNAILVIVTQTPRPVIARTITAHGLNPTSVFTLSASSDLVPTVLRVCDYGLLVMPESSRSPLVMSIKFAEYLAAGLPVICDEYVGGAAHIIKQHQVGLLLSNDWARNKEELERLQQSYAEVSAQCRKIAKELFSVHTHADRYAKLYQEAIA